MLKKIYLQYWIILRVVKLISAPLYFSYLAPKINNEYLPISQLDAPGTDKCFNKYQSQNNKLDYVFVDTRSLNDTFYGTKIKNYLNDYTIVESIYIGRLGTLSLDKKWISIFLRIKLILLQLFCM